MNDFIEFLKSETPQICVMGGKGTCAPLGGSVVLIIGLFIVFLMYKLIYKK